MMLKTNGIDPNFYLAPSKKSWAIFLISVLGLFLEMLLIRWIGTEIRIFAYLQNTVLVACFLGIGLGCFTCRKPIQLQHTLVPLAILLLLMSIPITRWAFSSTSEMLSVLGDFVIWYNVIMPNLAKTILSVVIGLTLTTILMILIVDIFVPIGRILGRMMDNHPNTIWAYSINIAGSLVGTWLFVLLSFLYQPPFTWFIVFGLLIFIFILWTKTKRKLNLLLLFAIIALSWFIGVAPNTIKLVWSPYQKLAVSEAQRINNVIDKYQILVNNSGYQILVNLSEAHTSANPDFYPPQMKGMSQYDLPLLFHPNAQSFLIVGAGSGNDAAAGVRHGVREITAVDIDPAIIEIGRQFHPEATYSSPSVTVVKDDARSFFATTTKKYDVISFGLLDSHTTTALTNARLDHYVYTIESIERAKALLADGGVLVLTFATQRDYIADRMAVQMEKVFGEEPMVIPIPKSEYGWGGHMFISGDLKTVRNQIAGNPRLGALIDQWQKDSPVLLSHNTKVTTDDWPYTYLESPSIPVLFYLLVVIMLLVLFVSARRWEAGNIAARWRRSHWHFFFLGAAFLLLEVQNVSKASVVLGNTWQVNAVIVSSVLIMALLANFIAYKFPKIPIRAAYTALISISLVLYFVDLAQFAFLPYSAKALIVGGLTTLPMLFSGVIFVRSFAGVEGKDEALGANMIGSLVGALLQSITFLFGIKALLLVVALLYFMSMLTLMLPQKAKQVVLQINEEQSH